MQLTRTASPPSKQLIYRAKRRLGGEMNIFVMHDKRGSIRGIVMSRVEGVGIKVPRGMEVHSFSKEEAEIENQRQFLVDLQRNFTVQKKAGKKYLAEKPAKSKKRPR